MARKKAIVNKLKSKTEVAVTLRFLILGAHAVPGWWRLIPSGERAWRTFKPRIPIHVCITLVGSRVSVPLYSLI